MSVHSQIDQQIDEQRNWSLRRQLGIPNNRRLWVLACMDERLPIEKALGIAEKPSVKKL
jgi:carbonic anhydrase